MASKHRVEGGAHFTSSHREAVARRALVETAVVSEPSIGIEDVEVGSALRIVCSGDQLRPVVEKRKREIVLDGHLAKFLRRVVGVGGEIVRTDRYEGDAFRLVMARDSQNLVTNVNHIRTVPADKHYHQCLGVGQLSERDRFSGDDVRK